MRKIQALIVGIFAVLSLSVSAQSISVDSKLLAQCEITYFYVGQLLQLQNNEEGAKALIRRSAMMTTANFLMNAENGVVAGWKIREFTLLREPLKRDFDSGARKPMTAAADCDRKAIPVAIKIRDTGALLWGKSFDALQLEFFNHARKLLGL
jgi:hypothetical protein